MQDVQVLWRFPEWVLRLYPQSEPSEPKPDHYRPDCPAAEEMQKYSIWRWAPFVLLSKKRSSPGSCASTAAKAFNIPYTDILSWLNFTALRLPCQNAETAMTMQWPHFFSIPKTRMHLSPKAQNISAGQRLDGRVYPLLQL